jgi:hypothetical protein
VRLLKTTAKSDFTISPKKTGAFILTGSNICPYYPEVDGLPHICGEEIGLCENCRKAQADIHGEPKDYKVISNIGTGDDD